MKYRTLTYTYVMMSIFVSHLSIIPSMTFIHQIVLKILNKIAGPWNIGHWPTYILLGQACVALTHYPKYSSIKQLCLFLFVWFLFYSPSTHTFYVISGVVSDPNHTVPRQASYAIYQYLVHIFLPVTDNCSSWISGRGRMAEKTFQDYVSTKECAGHGDRTRGRLHAKDHQIAFEVLSKITQPWNIGHDDLQFRKTKTPMSYGWLISDIISSEGVSMNEKAEYHFLRCPSFTSSPTPGHGHWGQNLWNWSWHTNKYECFLMSGWGDIL